jgi:hypothetical protein
MFMYSHNESGLEVDFCTSGQAFVNMNNFNPRSVVDRATIIKTLTCSHHYYLETTAGLNSIVDGEPGRYFVGTFKYAIFKNS